VTAEKYQKMITESQINRINLTAESNLDIEIIDITIVVVTVIIIIIIKYDVIN